LCQGSLNRKVFDVIRTLIAPKPTSDSTNFHDERERLHRQMLSAVSHDLKTPLVSIIGALEVLERMKDKLSDDKKLSLVNIALQEAYRLDNFIANILDMARLENKRVKIKREKIKIRDTIRHCLTGMNNHLRESTIHFNTSNSTEVITDPVLLCRVLGLVLDNAIQYGGKSPVIHIEYGADEMNVGFITIRDNGEGIPEAQLKNIFSKYTQYGRQGSSGTGLGLTISTAIMKLLNGTITAANHPNGGAVFTLRFPLS